MNFLNKIFASSLNRGSFQIEDVSGSEEDQDEIPEHQEIPQFKKQSIQQLSSYNSRKKPQPKIGQADFLAKYDENFDDVFGDKPPPIDFPKGRRRRQEEEEEDENDNDNERKSQKKKTQSKERKQQSKEQKDQSKEQKEQQKDNRKITKEFRETIDYKEFNKEFKEPLEPKILKEPKIRLPKFPKQRKRIANNHLSTLRSNSDGRESVSNKDRESIQLNNKYNPNEIALPQTALPKSEKKQDKQKTMFFTFGMNDDDDSDSEKEIKNRINELFYDQKQKIDQNEQQSKDNNNNKKNNNNHNNNNNNHNNNNNNSHNHLKEKKEQEKKKQNNDEKKDRNEKKQRKEKKDNDKKIINHLNIFDEIKDIQKNLNSKQNSEQRETRKLNSEQREKKRDKKRESKQNREKNQKLTSKSPSPQLKLIQYETQKRVKRSQKRVVQDLEMLNVDELSLNPNIVECKANLYLDYIPVFD